MVIVWVKDLFFGSKIEAEARAHHIPVCFVESAREIPKAVRKHEASLFLLDLNASEKAVDVIRDIKSNSELSSIRIVGFLSHVQADLADKARRSGCDVILSRSIFVGRLPEIFEHYQAEIKSVEQPAAAL